MSIFSLFCLMFLVGVLVNTLFNFSFSFILFIFLLGILFFVLYFIFKKRIFIYFVIFFISLSIGMLRLNTYLSSPPQIPQEKSLVKGIVIDEPDIWENNQRIIVKVEEINNFQFKRTFKILVITDKFQNFGYGDEVLIKGVFKKPNNFINEKTGKVFDYVNYLAKDKIYYLIFYPQIEKTGLKKGNKFITFLFDFKEKIKNSTLWLGLTESKLLNGLIIGAKDSLPSLLKENLIKTGTIHIVALSGFNITIIAKSIELFFLYFLPFSLALIFSILGIIIFVIFVGLPITAIRAGLMAILVILGRIKGRDSQIGRLILLTAFLIVFVNPYSLTYDVSFQLSFLATLGIIYFTPVVEKNIFNFKKKPNYFQEIILTTISAYIFVLPFLLWKMGVFSTVAILVNILILPLIPLTMFFGFLAAFFGLFSYFLALPFGLISQILLKYIIFVVNKFSNLPFASFSISISFIMVIFSYLLFCFLIKKNYQEKI